MPSMTPAEYASHAGIPVQTVYSSIRSGRVVAEKSSGRWLIDVARSDSRREGVAFVELQTMTVSEYAAHAGVTRSVVMRGIKSGLVVGNKSGRAYAIDVEASDRAWSDRVELERGNSIVEIYKSASGEAVRCDDWPIESARVICEALHPGARMTGLTKGQVSQIDLLLASLTYTGPAHVYVASFSTSIKDTQTMRALKKSGLIKSARFVLDRGSSSVKPEWSQAAVDAFGPQAVRHSINHAKVVVVDGESGCVAIRSSMNMNRNIRHEQFDIDCDRGVVDFYLRWFGSLESLAPCGGSPTHTEAKASLEGALGGGLAASHVYRAVIDKPRAAVVAGEELEVDYYDERAKLERAKRALAELKVEEQRGTLVNAAAARKAWADVGAATRQRVLGIIPRVRDELAAMDSPHDVARRLEDELREALTMTEADLMGDA